MPETPGGPPDSGSHGEAGAAGEAIQIHRRDAAEHEQETSNEEDGQ